MLRKFLNSYFFFRLNKRFRFIDLYNIYTTENSDLKKWFRLSIAYFKKKHTQQNGILLIQKVEDYEYTIKMAAASKVYSEMNCFKVCSYNPYFTKSIGWINPIQEKYQRFFSNNIDQIYKAFGVDQIFDAQIQYRNQGKVKEELKKIRLNLKMPSDVLQVKINDIWVGDLIYDTYLRFFEQATINSVEDNADFQKILEISVNYFFSFNEFIEKTPVKTLFTTYTTYISHGIAVRICLERNISVYAFGIYSDVFKKIEKNQPYHCASHWEFSQNKFIAFDKLELAKKKLESRFSGEIDDAVSYMRVSSFSSHVLDEYLLEEFRSSKRNVVIYIHDFYDSSHTNRQLLFLDLFQFLKVTLDNIVSSEGTVFWIKIHPNWTGDCKERAIQLVDSYKTANFKILDESISNLNIVNLKPDLIVTARGTVAMEMAYFEIPVVALYDNPYVNFDFAHTCNDLESFFSIIKGSVNPTIDFNKEIIYSYYYQAYMEQLEGVDVDLFTKLQTFKEGTYTDEYLRMLKEVEKEVFCEKFLDNYRRKFASEGEIITK